MSEIDRNRWNAVRRLLEEALERPPEVRAAFLAALRNDDAPLADEVAELLAAEAAAGDLLEVAAAAAHPELLGEPPPTAASPAAGTTVGRYRLLETLGRGGMGEVWLAERSAGDFEQRVAVKLLRRGLASDELLRRFVAERRILAALEHPGIARLIDGGVTDDGHPYLVMEHVAGEPLTGHCDRRWLPLAARLEIFAAVCDAVHYAHQRLVVHRDLKPSNILVTDDGQPKLLDFGIAKLLGGEPAETTVTEYRLLTPEYASPEQLGGGAVTTASDVFSLGVLLYELLTGVRPYPSGLGGVSRRLSGEEAPPPSSALADGGRRSAPDLTAPTPDLGAAARGADPGALRRQLAGDLDAVVLTALAIDPGRRYATAAELAADLRDHLSGLPVRARRPTVRYRMGKFVRRHRVGVAASALAVLALLGGLAGTAWQAHRALWERDRAAEAARQAEQVASFLVSVFEVFDPAAASGETVSAHDLLDRAAARLGRESEQDPLLRARLLDTTGQVYQRLGLFDAARPLLEEALALRRAAHGELHPEVAASLDRLGLWYLDTGDHRRGRTAFEEALTILSRLDLGDSAEALACLRHLSYAVGREGDAADTEALRRKALAVARRLHAGDHPDLAQSLNDLGVLLRWKGAYDEAGPLLEEAVAMRRRLYHEPSSEVAASLANLAQLHAEQGDLERAEACARQSSAMRLALWGERHPEAASGLHVLAGVELARGRLAEARDLFQRALALRLEFYGEVHLAVAESRLGLAEVELADGRPEVARPLAEAALAAQRAVYPADGWRVGWAEVILGRALLAAGRAGEALPLLEHGHAGVRRQQGPASAMSRRAAEELERCRGAIAGAGT